MKSARPAGRLPSIRLVLFLIKPGGRAIALPQVEIAKGFLTHRGEVEDLAEEQINRVIQPKIGSWNAEQPFVLSTVEA